MPPATSSLPVVVCDMGTSTTRLGYAGNTEPTFELPTVCTWTDPQSYDTFCLGDEVATQRSAACTGTSRGTAAHRCNLLDHGAVTDWNAYEEYWRHLFHRRLCVESSDVGVVLAEAARASPSQRETIAEILFEGFGVARLHVGSQALFALSSFGGGGDADGGCDTAVVVDSGAGVTQVVPVVDGYAVSSAARRFPLAGRDITQYVLDSLRAHQRGALQAARAWEVAERVKLRYSYVAKDITREIASFEANMPAHVIRHREVHHQTGKPYEVEVGYEQLLAPEVLFQPALLQPGFTTGLPDLIDAVVSSCPIDSRRRLYENVVICGGNLRFPKLAKRLERSLRALLEQRAANLMAASGSALSKQVAYEMHVRDASQDAHAVWRGGSLFGSSARFASEAVSRAEYQERGRFYAEAAEARNTTGVS